MPELNPQLLDMLQEQFNLERYNAASYEAMAYNLDAVNWPGTAKHFHQAAADERAHAQKFADYLITRNAVPQVEELPAPVTVTADLYSAFDMAMQRELATGAAILALYKAADEMEDEGLEIFLQWFITEQEESEREYKDILLEVGRADCSAALLILDREYGGK